MYDIIAFIAVIGFIGISVFQFLIVLGYPLGHLAYGGIYDHQVLPRNYRITSAISIGLYMVASIVVLERAEVIQVINDSGLVTNLTWGFALFLSLGTVMNAISKSKQERNLWTPIVFVMAICCYILAFFT